MVTRIIIIFWRWNMPSQTFPCFFFTSDNEAKLYCINQITLESEWAPYLQEIFDVHINAEYLLFLHEDEAFLPEKRQSIVKFFSNMQYIVHAFYGGKEFVYYNDTLETGLLWNGTLVKDKLYTATRQRHSIFDNNNNIELKYFNPVWNHYYYASKRRLFEAQEYLLHHFMPLDQLPNQKLMTYIDQQQLEQLDQHLKKSIFSGEIQKSIKGDQSENRIFEAYQALLNHLELDLATPNYLKLLNYHFVKVINLMPGTIY